MTRARLAAALLAIAGTSLLAPRAARAQGWAVNVYAGGVREGALATLPSSNFVANLRWAGASGAYLYASAAAPLGADATTWGAAGAAYRLTAATAASFSVGIELAADGYAYDEPVLGTTGVGAALRAMPVAGWSSGPASFELRAGRREHVFRRAGDGDTRGLWETGARARLALGPALATLDARWLAAPEAEYPFLGAQVVASHPFGRVWASGGKWFGDELDDAGWGAGASAEIGRFGEVWASYRDEPTDPLYPGGSRRAWTVGLSVPLTRRPDRRAADRLAPRVDAGSVRILLPLELGAAAGSASSAGSAGTGRSGNGHDGSAAASTAPAVAGEFSDWRPVPMRLADDGWVLDLELASGVYRFAFVGPHGEWFVPEGYPGRMDDGMGGHVALLIVP